MLDTNICFTVMKNYPQALREFSRMQGIRVENWV
jgi:hypothetical protein